MNAPEHPTHQLSKSRYVTGLQCPKLLWWKVHEPDAPELIPDPKAQATFDRGHRVGELARTHVPGGVLIDVPPYAVRERVAATAAALAAGAPVIYEASFVGDEVFAAVDILEKTAHGYALVEVKSTLDVKPEHIPDVAIQLHVARGAGLPVARAEVMHLNRHCRFPDLSNLFVREDVTAELTDDLSEIPERIRALRSVLAGPLPDVSIGAQCSAPYPCVFRDRCWPVVPEYGVDTLYRLHGAKAAELIRGGIRSLLDLPEDYPASGPALRQLQSVRRGEMIVEPGLRDTLALLTPPIAFLDFETISPAVPVWPGCRPCQAVPVQFSCQRLGPGGIQHVAWLAHGAGDPQEKIARALIAACAGAKTVLVYNSPFERRCIEGLAAALPHLAGELRDLSGRLRDLLVIMRDHVYHPAFGGSFSIKKVLPALVPGSGYENLEIQEGAVASALLERLLLDGNAFIEEERLALRGELLRYCELDTLAMVHLHERLQELAAGQ